MYKYNGYYYDVVKLWEITKHNKVNIGEISDFVDQTISKIWTDSWGNRYSVSEILANPKSFREHYDRMKEVNLEYPVMVNQDLSIIDGYHRLGQTLRLGLDKIKYVVVDFEQLQEAIIKVDNKDPPKFIFLVKHKNWKMESFESSEIGYSYAPHAILKYLKYKLKIPLRVDIIKNKKSFIHTFKIKELENKDKLQDINLNLVLVRNYNFTKMENLVDYLEFQGNGLHKIINIKKINVYDFLKSSSLVSFI